MNFVNKSSLGSLFFSPHIYLFKTPFVIGGVGRVRRQEEDSKKVESVKSNVVLFFFSSHRWPLFNEEFLALSSIAVVPGSEVSSLLPEVTIDTHKAVRYSTAV